MAETMTFFNAGLRCWNIKKLVGWLKFTGIGMEVQRMKKGQCWGFEFTSSKVPLVNWFLLQHNSMTDTVVFFNAGLSCRNIKKLVGWLKFTGIGMEV
jgi:hypothetical protein